MKILHCALSCFYIEGFKYQENVLPTLHAQMGHQVMMLASCVSYNKEGKACLVEPTQYRSDDGFDVIRLPYRKGLGGRILRRTRLYPGVYKILEEFKPDIIYFHGCNALELHTFVKYKKKHPEVVLFLDSHTDRNNSASTKLSLHVQHKIMYRSAVKKVIPYAEKFLCPSIECMDFLKEVYKVPETCLEFYPLGGMLRSEQEQQQARKQIREKENVPADCTVFAHSGKMDAKKRTIEIIDAFRAVPDPSFRLWIIGVLMDDVKDEILKKIEDDSRISYLGWKNSDELQDYLCAADVYVQPGGQSATMQNAMCCSCAVMLYPHKSHKPYVDKNGYYISNTQDMIDVFTELSNNPEKVGEMRKRSQEIASEILDYNKMAQRVCVQMKQGGTV